MDPRKLFFDERLRGVCVYCGAKATSRDHVPSKVLLDEPYPVNLSVVDACESCNNSYSKDEPYVACLLECILRGSTSQAAISGREKVQRIFAARPNVAADLEVARVVDQNGNVSWLPHLDRVERVVAKLAAGHAAYELSELCLGWPEHIRMAPLASLTDDERKTFENCDSPQRLQGWPEIGSRAFCKMAAMGADVYLDNGWTEVQRGLYRYVALPGTEIRIVLSEYLACEIAW